MTDDDFILSVTTAIAEAGLDYCRPSIPSTTLQNALIVQVADSTHASIFLTYYWALYVHDGRAPFIKSTIMCWFRDPKLDPRLNAGVTPARLTDVRHLSPDEFRFWLAQNRAAERAAYGRLRRPGEPQVGPMIITKEIKTPTAASNFFENDGGMAGFIDTIYPLVGPMMSDYVCNDVLKDVLNLVIPCNMQINTY